MPTRHRSSVICLHEDKLLTVKLQDPTTGETRSFLPGGMIEPGESPEDAAIRETMEETGYSVTLKNGSKKVLQYPFLWDGKIYECTTHFFRAVLKDGRASPQAVNDASYHRGVFWLPLDEAPTNFDYHQAVKTLLVETLELP